MSESGVNELFPVFLKANELDILLVGGGIVALEKLKAVLGGEALKIDDRSVMSGLTFRPPANIKPPLLAAIVEGAPTMPMCISSAATKATLFLHQKTS